MENYFVIACAFIFCLAFVIFLKKDDKKKKKEKKYFSLYPRGKSGEPLFNLMRNLRRLYMAMGHSMNRIEDAVLMSRNYRVDKDGNLLCKVGGNFLDLSRDSDIKYFDSLFSALVAKRKEGVKKIRDTSPQLTQERDKKLTIILEFLEALKDPYKDLLKEDYASSLEGIVNPFNEYEFPNFTLKDMEKIIFLMEDGELDFTLLKKTTVFSQSPKARKLIEDGQTSEALELLKKWQNNVKERLSAVYCTHCGAYLGKEDEGVYGCCHECNGGF